MAQSSERWGMTSTSFLVTISFNRLRSESRTSSAGRMKDQEGRTWLGKGSGVHAGDGSGEQQGVVFGEAEGVEVQVRDFDRDFAMLFDLVLEDVGKRLHERIDEQLLARSLISFFRQLGQQLLECGKANRSVLPLSPVPPLPRPSNSLYRACTSV